MSSGLFTVLSRYSRNSASPMPPTRPTRKASVMFLVLAGRAGEVGTMAGGVIWKFGEGRAPGKAGFFILNIQPPLGRSGKETAVIPTRLHIPCRLFFFK